MRMYRLFPVPLITLALTACAAGSNPAVDLAAEEAAVRAASEAVVAEEMEKDIDGTLVYWAEDAVFHMEGMPAVTGKEGLRGVYEAFFGDTTMLGFEGTTTDVEVAAGGGLAWEHGVNRFQVKGPDGPVEAVGKYLVVWRKSEMGWKIAALAVTNDAPPDAM